MVIKNLIGRPLYNHKIFLRNMVLVQGWTFMNTFLQFALGPSDFEMCNVGDEELKEGTSHGVKVLYKFPWGSETLETLWSLGDTLLLKTHQGTCTKLQRWKKVCSSSCHLYQCKCG